MSSSYVSNHVHIVFSTKNRLKVIPEDLQLKLWAYMAGIATNHDMHAVAIGGIEDHVHALIDMGLTLCIAKTVQVLKANSSRWINDHPGMRFGWQILPGTPVPGYRLFRPRSTSSGQALRDWVSPVGHRAFLLPAFRVTVVCPSS
jgi:REP element-mobilizing transposase RayT